MTGPAVASIRPGLWRMRLPFRFELDHVNAFLLAASPGYILIDSGVGSAESMVILEASLQRIGVKWEQIHTILLTHGHPDHSGGVARVQQRTGARLLMNPVEMSVLADLAGTEVPPDPLPGWGVPEAQHAAVQTAFRRVIGRFAEMKPDRDLGEGDRVGSDLGDWTVVVTPGHSPGHVCLFQGEQRLLLTGDHVLPDISPNVSWRADSRALAGYMEGLERLAALEARAGVPSHGSEFASPGLRCGELAAHHRSRCERIRALCMDDPTPHQIVERIWGGRLDAFNYRFAIHEIVAHLELMEDEGSLRRVSQAPARWRAA